MTPPTDRSRRLRDHALQRIEVSYAVPDQAYLAARSWLQTQDEPWTVIRRAKECAAILHGLTPVIDQDELIVGKFCYRSLTDSEQAEYENYRKYAAPARPPVWGQRAHMAIDYEKLLKLGIVGFRRQIDHYRQPLDLSRPDDLEKDAFYRAVLITLDGLEALASHYADMAERKASAESDPKRREELFMIAKTCRQVPLNPAGSFYEALQMIHFVTFALCAGNQMLLFQLGRPDRYLLPFYRRDIEKGIITVDQAQEWIDCLNILFSEYTPPGLAVGYMIGGQDSAGNDVSNELTALFLHSIEHTRLSYPGVGLAWNRNTPEWVMETSAHLLAQGLSHPAIFNDEVIMQGLMDAGLPPSEACLYQHSTCVEITPIASSNVYVASPYINLLQLLHDILGIPPLADGSASKASQALGSATPSSFDELLMLYRKHLSAAIREAVIAENTGQATRRYNGGFPFLSCFVNDCLERGKDIDHGGARYNWIEPSFVGLSNLVDALHAIREFVYERNTISLAELTEALKHNFEGKEDLRQMLLNKAAKYGNDEDEVDSLSITISEWVKQEVQQYTTYLGGRFLSGFFVWIMHEILGRQTAASADGRKAGFPLGDGSGPAQGRERLGPTAAVLSTTKWNHSPHIGGIAMNLKFSRPRQVHVFEQRLQDILQTYLERGGFEVQVNVVNKADLEDALIHPELHRDLVVRIGGYSDYFVRLSPEMQAEIILRTEHEGA